MPKHLAVNDILTAWNENASMGDMYHMILAWMEAHVGDVEITKEVQTWLRWATDGKETNDMVEAFLYDAAFAKVRTRS